jgi:hypothetical protein
MIALKMEAVRTSETLVNLYQNTWRYNPDDSHLVVAARTSSHTTAVDTDRSFGSASVTIYVTSCCNITEYSHVQFKCLKRIFVPKRDEVTEHWRNLIMR